MFKKGQSGNPAGRPVGVKNKTSENIRKILLDFTSDNQFQLQEWLLKTAETDPARAYELWLKTLNYILPKLSETEISSLGEKINIVLPPKVEKNNQ